MAAERTERPSAPAGFRRANRVSQASMGGPPRATISRALEDSRSDTHSRFFVTMAVLPLVIVFVRGVTLSLWLAIGVHDFRSEKRVDATTIWGRALVFGGLEGVAEIRHPVGMGVPAIDHEIELGQHGKTTIRDIPGPPGAETVMLLHGLGATARLNWGPSFRPLSQDFRVLGVDHRGHGRGLRTRRFRLEQCADDAVDAARARGVRRFIAVGYSMGGPIASLAWRRHPEHVAGLVLCATARNFMPRSVARAARIALPAAAALARLAPSAAHQRLLQRMLGRIEHPELRERVYREFAGHDPSSVSQATYALSGFSSHDWVGDVDVPTAVVVTTRDELVPPDRQRELAASISGAEVFEVEGDHGACVARASRFVPALVAACRSVERRIASATG